MSKLIINTDGLIQNANTLAKRLQELQRLNSQLENLIHNIEGSWEGRASKAYVHMMQRYLNQGLQLERVLLEFINYAKSASERFQNSDKSAATKIYSSF